MNQLQHLLVIDDDKDILSLLKDFFQKHQYQVSILNSGSDIQHFLMNTRIDLIILDIMLPDIDGFEVCRKIREKYRIPIIMLTAVSEETDRIVGLEMGADDYLTKPFSPRELLARIRAISRRLNHKAAIEKANDSGSAAVYLFSNWKLQTSTRQLFSPNEVEIILSAGEYELLLAFLKHPNRVLSRDFLLDHTKNRELGPFDRSIDVLVSRLRQKIEENPKQPCIIKTIRSGGYLFQAMTESQ